MVNVIQAPRNPFSFAFFIASCFLAPNSPFTRPLNPKTIFFPPYSVISTSLESPGSNLIEVPAGILR